MKILSDAVESTPELAIMLVRQLKLRNYYEIAVFSAIVDQCLMLPTLQARNRTVQAVADTMLKKAMLQIFDQT